MVELLPSKQVVESSSLFFRSNNGLFDKGLSRRPFTAKSRVRFPYRVQLNEQHIHTSCTSTVLKCEFWSIGVVANIHPCHGCAASSILAWTAKKLYDDTIVCNIYISYILSKKKKILKSGV